jgi:hypothetical protein
MEYFKFIKLKREYMNYRLELKDSMILFFAIDEEEDNSYWFEYLSDFKSFDKVDLVLVKFFNFLVFETKE